MTPRYTSKLGLKICPTNIEMQKIDGSIFKIFEIVLTSFQIKGKLKKAQFFQKTVLLADLNLEMVLKMTFFTLNNINI